MVLVFLWQTPFSMIIFKPIHVAANGTISFFFLAERYASVCVCVCVCVCARARAHAHTTSYLSIHLSTDIEVASMSRFSSVQFSCSVVSNYLQPHGLQHTRPPCPSPTPEVYSNPRPLSRWSHLTILSSFAPFSSRLQSFPASGSFPMSQFFTSGVQSIGISASASVLPMIIQDWFPLGLTGWISLQSKGL